MKALNKKEIKKKFKKNKRDKEIYVLIENIQYARNVASIFRTCDAAGVRKLLITGISTTPPFGKDLTKASRAKEKSVQWEYFENTGKAIKKLKHLGFKVYAVELTLEKKIENEEKVCFLVGNEVHGVKKETLASVDDSIYIPMYGRGASLNVGVSLAVVLFSF
jgi:tRNA G18 (ribose-2'-O)-methylase SpoU